MGDIRTVVRIEVDINGHRYVLAPGQDPEEVKRRIQEAAPGSFVELTVGIDRTVSAFISSGSQIVVTTETVEIDAPDGESSDSEFDAY